MKKGIKIALIVISALIIIIVALPFLFKGKIKEIVKRETSAMFTANVEFKNVSLSLIRNFPNASVKISELSISGRDTFAGDTLLYSKSIFASVDLFSLFGDEIDITKIEIDRPAIHARKLADGAVNWDIMVADTASTEPESVSESSSFDLSLKNVKINDGTLSFMDDSTAIMFYTDDLNLKLRGDLSDDQSDISLKISSKNLSFASGKITMISGAEIEGDINVFADFEKGKYTLQNNKIRLNALEAALDGWVVIDDNYTDMDIKLNTSKIEFRDILSMIPAFYTKDFAQLSASGTIAVDGWAKGRLSGDDIPAFNVSLTVKDGSFKYASLPKSVDNINIEASASNSANGAADNTVININNLSLGFAGNSLKVSMNCKTPISDPNFSLKAVANVNLGMIKEVYPLDSMQLDGTIITDLAVAARMSDIDKERYENVHGQGKIEVREMKASVKGMPELTISRAAASISAASAQLSELNVKIGESDVNITGEVSNYLPYIMKNAILKGRIAIVSKKLDLNQLMGTSEATEQADTTVSATTSIEIPTNLDLRMDASLSEVLFQQMVLKNIIGEIVVKDGRASLNKLNMNAMGGTMTTSGHYKSGLSPKVDMKINISKASFSQTFKELDLIRKFVPIFEKTGGNYSMTMNMNTALDGTMSPIYSTLSADGVISSSDIKIQNLKVFEIMASLTKDSKLANVEAKDIKIPFEVKDGKLTTSPFDLKLPGANVGMNGYTTLDGNINYTAKINITSGAVAGFVSNIPVKITGTFTKPEVKLGVQDVVKDVIKQTIAKELGIDAEKVRSEAASASKKLVELAQSEANKLVEKSSNPLAKLAAKKSGELLVKEAQKQGQKLIDEAEKKITAAGI